MKDGKFAGGDNKDWLAGWLGRVAHSYFDASQGPPLTDLRSALWVEPDVPRESLFNPETPVVLQQYKIYVEMADRISARRGISNPFFLTLNTIIFTAIGVFWQRPPAGSNWLLIVSWVVLVIQCLAWFWLLGSYRQLNTAKYKVVGMLEERLPASPYWRTERQTLAKVQGPAACWPLSHIEQIPMLFSMAYTVGFVTLLLASV